MSTLTAARPTTVAAGRRSTFRGVGAVVAGLLSIVVLSSAADAVLRAAGVYPSLSRPMEQPALYLLALAYRTVFSVLGCYLAARLAPRAPMRHAMALGAVGVLVSMGGVIANVQAHLGPNWYPVSLVLVALPCAWLGGRLHGERES